MLNAATQRQGHGHTDSAASGDDFRDIHPLNTPPPPPPTQRSSWWVQERRRPRSWDQSSRSRTSMRSDVALGGDTAALGEQLAALAITRGAAQSGEEDNHGAELHDRREEMNPLAIVPDGGGAMLSPQRGTGAMVVAAEGGGGVSVAQVRKEEVESKIAAWETAEVMKINNRMKREEVIIKGWETDQVEKALARLNKIERKLEATRAKAMEKADNEVARARRKSEERRASAEAKRGTKVAQVLEMANFMRAVGRAPTTRRALF